MTTSCCSSYLTALKYKTIYLNWRLMRQNGSIVDFSWQITVICLGIFWKYFQVHVRLKRDENNSNRKGTFLCGIAIKVGDDVLVIDQCVGGSFYVQLYVNDRITPGFLYSTSSDGNTHTVSLTLKFKPCLTILI